MDVYSHTSAVKDTVSMYQVVSSHKTLLTLALVPMAPVTSGVNFNISYSYNLALDTLFDTPGGSASQNSTWTHGS